MSICYIYALIDPRTDEIFYVGSSINPEQRFYQHINLADSVASRMRIDEIRKDDKEPEIRILEETTEEQRRKCEQEWINNLRNSGLSLTNMRPVCSRDCQRQENHDFDTKWLGTSEVAIILGLSRGAVLRYIREGQLQATKRGKVWIIDKSALKAFERRGPGRPSSDKNKAVVADYIAGIPVSEIAQKYDMTEDAIYKAASRVGQYRHRQVKNRR